MKPVTVKHCLWLAAVIVSCPLIAGPITEVADKDGGKLIQVTTPAFELLVNPARGGQIVSAVLKPGGVQLGNPGSPVVGLFAEHDTKQNHPGELMNAPYEAKTAEEKDGTAVITLTRVAEGGWRGEAPPSIKGLKYEKSYRVNPSLARIDVACRITNTSTENKLLDYWLQSVARIGGNDAINYYFRPTADGLSVTSSEDAQGARQFVLNPAEGWCAVVNRQLKISCFYLFDRATIDRLYNCTSAFTQEFMYQRVPLPPGKSWETKLKLRIVEGVDQPVFASDVLVAGANVESLADKTIVRHRIAAMDKPLKNVRIVSKLRDIRTNFDIKAEEKRVDEIGAAAVEIPAEFNNYTGGAKTLSVSISYDGGALQYEFPVTMLGDVSFPYRRAVEPVVMSIPKPDNIEAVWTAARKKPAGILRIGDSLSTKGWRFDEFAKSANLPVVPCPYTPGSWWKNAALGAFPIALDDLFRYDVVVLLDGDAKALRFYGCDMLRDYVKQGGGVLFLGGYNCYGKASIDGTPLAEIMPVKPTGCFDLKPAKENTPAKGAGTGVFADAAKGAKVDWYHETVPAEGAEVFLTIDGKPLLVGRSFGKGKVLAWTGSALGADSVKNATAGNKTPAIPEPLMKAMMDWIKAK